MSKASLPVRSAVGGLLALALLAVPVGALAGPHAAHGAHRIADQAGDFPYEPAPSPPDRE
jgi:hypothetical protein